MPDAPPPRRTPLSVRIAAWRRGIIVGSLGVFIAAWLAVVDLGKSATAQPQGQSSQSIGSSGRGSSEDDSGDDDSYDSEDFFGDDDGSSSDDSSSGDSGSSQSDMSGATTSQS